MYYEIISNRFAPKISEFKNEKPTLSHSVCFGKCNFNCKFCDFTDRPIIQYRSFDNASFTRTIEQLIEKGNCFKFTGGEPTLNPHLEEHLKIVRSFNGFVYLDSNGSNPQKIENLLKQELIDVLGISLKGVTPEEAMQTSNVRSQKLVWDNVFETLRIAASYKDKTRTIVTLVFTKENRFGRLQKFADLLAPFENVYMKINNLQPNVHSESAELHSVDRTLLYDQIDKFVTENPEWKNRTIFIPSEQGVSDYNSIIFF